MEKIIRFSVKNKLLVFLFIAAVIGGGIYSLMNLPVGSVPDITNNQVQVITTSRNLSTQDVEKYLTYPVELEMANLPNLKEVRSVSKFGLSVVTLVFDDEIGTFIPRQLIEEKLKLAKENIPAGFGTPFMGPITTGLGEIYQYTLEVDEKHKGNYSVTELRTIQDWIVKRQLSGIPGVVEVNTWGGYLKQYEISIDPLVISSMEISMTEIFDALEKNNSIAGGGYIEKGEQTYFVRGEGLVSSIEDIKQIPVKVVNGIPLLIKDVADVKIGNANRFGAVTGNGEGEKVMGQIMMLKGANAMKVINDVNDKVAEVNKSLPEGISIVPFLERSELIEKTTFTISENLVLGFVIVFLVVVLLLGDLRSGLVVASIIPLTLLIALSAMYVFGVDANLMSLGAIDFGIIIDGAVIIVEFIAFKIVSHSRELSFNNKLTQHDVDEITISSTSKMMKSAVFGQIIIMIVFIPILTLSGVEGKMFRPMALVFVFAILGAMLLCFTYVPVIASLLVKPKKKHKESIAEKIMNFVNRIYMPVFRLSIRLKSVFIAGAALLLVIAVVLFGRMGAEFIPTLDEGDVVIQPALRTGTSLSETIRISTEIEKQLLHFPEVQEVVTRIGAAEVPTDPMSLEEGDVIIKLIPKEEWTSASEKDELVGLFKEELKNIPGAEFEFTQPIEMRFNELITGVRADLAIKIFGEDLDMLNQLAHEVEQAISNVDGASDIIVEKTAGLPQMIVKYKKDQVAKYGVDIESLNNLLTMGFGGKTAGTVFEGEKQFDLVVRLDEEFRKDIDNIKQLPVVLPNKTVMPLEAFADIYYDEGPAKISRDDTKRRVVIGVNVRGRDLESVVKDIQTIIDNEVDFPDGYTVTYGGQYENLANARNRLMIAIPISLVLIFILLYFAFNSLKETLMIFTAIPLSAVGGVFLLWLRDMPFSISAGVGFIALFGISVLNGIVLIEEFRELREKGYTNLNRIIMKGTSVRLRPVILTASAAALGFLPMAISGNAGAEVQRPLATVVIGGLISATILTLVILPNLYVLFNRKSSKKSSVSSKAVITILVAFISVGVFGQTTISMEEAVDLSKTNNLTIKAAEAKIRADEYWENTSFDLEKTEVYYGFDQNNIAPNNIPLHVLGVTQNFKMPGFYKSKKEWLESQTALSAVTLDSRKFYLERQVSEAYLTVVYYKQQISQLEVLDSLYEKLLDAITKGVVVGEFAESERDAISLQHNDVAMNLASNWAGLESAQLMLNYLIYSDTIYDVQEDELNRLGLVLSDTANNPYLKYLSASNEVLKSEQLMNRKDQSPEFNVGVFNGVNQGVSPNSYMGVQIGLSFNIQSKVEKSKVSAREQEYMANQFLYEDHAQQLMLKSNELLKQIGVLEQKLQYYEKEGNAIYDRFINTAFKSLQLGDVSVFEFTQMMKTAYSVQEGYLNTMMEYNSKVLSLKYLSL